MCEAVIDSNVCMSVPVYWVCLYIRMFVQVFDCVPVCLTGDQMLYTEDSHFKDLILFYEYFDGDTGRGCGAK